MAEYPTYLIHYGTPGQKWGTRRYQNEDGSLTPEGREHYGLGERKIRNFESGKKDYTEYVAKNRQVRKYLNKSESRKAYIEVTKKSHETEDKIREEASKRAREARLKLDPDSESKLYTTKLDDKVWNAGNKAANEYLKSPEIKEILKQRDDEWKKAYNDYKKDAEKIISEVLGDYGKTKDKYTNKTKNSEAAERIIGRDKLNKRYK